MAKVISLQYQIPFIQRSIVRPTDLSQLNVSYVYRDFLSVLNSCFILFCDVKKYMVYIMVMEFVFVSTLINGFF